ncbi:ArsR family transcriptional regulator [Clostridium sp.]|uniref:ArsR/SmtB family transcription factor n=1 Tax=Clostridium sp. TaxID=1506 RepID=UPI0032176D4A
MKFIVEDNINLIEEVKNTLYFIVNEEKLVLSLRDMFKRNGIDGDKYISKDLKSLFKFIERFKAKNKIPMDKLRIFFKDISKEHERSHCIASMLIMNMTPEELIEGRKRILNLDEGELKELVMKDILCQEDYIIDDFPNDEDLYELDAGKEFMPYLMGKCSLDSETKWWLTVISQNPKTYLVQLLDMIIDSIDNFKETFKVMEKEVDKFVEELRGFLDENENFISDSTGIRCFEEWERDIYIYPGMINFNSVSFTSNKSFTFNSERNEYMYFGWKIYEFIKTTRGKDNEEELLIDRLKCISDKSKFSIVKMLKEKSMFGQEIATALSLTTATVSYHMNALVLAKLVYIEKVENKVFYNIDKEQINKFLDGLTKELI